MEYTFDESDNAVRVRQMSRLFHELDIVSLEL